MMEKSWAELELDDCIRDVEEQKTTVTSYHSRAAQLLAVTGVLLSILASGASSLKGQIDLWNAILFAVLVAVSIVCQLIVLLPRNWEWSFDRSDWRLLRDATADVELETLIDRLTKIWERNAGRFKSMKWAYTAGAVSFGFAAVDLTGIALSVIF